MTKEQRPTSKVIQLAKASGDNMRLLCEDGSIWLEYGTKEVCEDGSIWLEYGTKEDCIPIRNCIPIWKCILEPHKEPVEEEPKETYCDCGLNGCCDVCGLTESDIMEGRPCDRKCSKCNKIIGDKDGYSGQSNNNIVTCLSCTYLHQPRPKEATEKLPEVGKRYKAKNGNIFKITKQEKKYFLLTSEESGQSYSYDILEIKSRFEELPDQEPTTKEARDFLSDFHNNKFSVRYGYKMSKEAQEAFEELKHALGCWDYCGKWPTRDGEYGYVFDTARNLVNALEAHQTKQETPVSSIVEHTSEP